MFWPNPADFSRMLQSPSVAFRDEQLQQCEVENNHLGQPRPWSGNFATVYRGVYPQGGSVAIRVFNLGRRERRERYDAISQYLKELNLRSMVKFDYIEEGIRSPTDGKFYPLVTMEWVEGDTLFDWLGRRCDENDTDAISEIADRWVDLVAELRGARIAHGDLQHGNVMVSNTGELKLVDYDCMCVPELIGSVNLEIGMPPYQHPGRDGDTLLSLELDHFSSIFILVALRALAANPMFWTAYVEGPEYDKLLLKAEDFENSVDSRLIRDLMRSPDTMVRELTEQLLEAYHGGIDQVPSLDTLVDPFSRVEELLGLRDWDTVIELLQHSKKADDAPDHLQGPIREAYDRVSCRRELAVAVEAGNEVEMQRLYLPGLLDDYPAAQELVDVAKTAGDVIPVLKQLGDSYENGAWREFVLTWDQNRSLLEGRKSAEQYVEEVQRWRARNEAYQNVLLLLNAPAPSASELQRAWGKLIDVGGHPAADRLEGRVQNLLKRDRVWQIVAAISDDLAEETDQELISAWDDEVLQGFGPAEEQRYRFEEARSRLTALARLRALTTEYFSHFTFEGEREIVAASGALPEEYQHGHTQRVQQAERRISAMATLQSAMDRDGPEAEIAIGWKKLIHVGGEDMLSDRDRPRIDLAQRRLPLLKNLMKISEGLPLDQQDARVIEVWVEDDLRDCGEAGPWRRMFDSAVQRRTVLGRLEQALEARDDHQTTTLATDPILVGYPLPSTWIGPMQLAKQRMRETEELVTALEQGDGERLSSAFDVAMFAKFAEVLEPYQDQLFNLTAEYVRPLDRIGLRTAFRSGLVKISRDKFRLRWAWPKSRFSNECIVTLSPQQPSPNQSPETVRCDTQVRIDRRAWDLASGSHLLEIDEAWGGDFVAVWSVIDLGFAVLYSEPLLLGQLAETRASKRRRKGKA